MTEIGKNIGNYGYNIEKIGKKTPADIKDNAKEQKTDEAAEYKYAPNSGVLGRSQVNASNGANITKSVNEAVAIATKRPDILQGSECIFDSVYQNLIENGMDESDAYLQALMAEEEFLGVAHNH